MTTKKTNHQPVTKSYFPLLVIVSIIMGACTKQKTPPSSPAILHVYNALDDGKMVRVNMSGAHPIRYSTAYPLLVRNIGKFNSREAIQPMAFYGAADTLPKDNPVWEGNLELETGKIYSMILYSGPAKAEAIILKESFPRNITDSVTFLRVTNLSKTQSVTINLAGDPHGSLISNVDYQAITPFVQLPVNRSIVKYVFEARDAGTGTLLATHTVDNVNNFQYTNLLFRTSWTLILTGWQGGTGNNMLRLSPMFHL